jgi:hypothetical protein
MRSLPTIQFRSGHHQLKMLTIRLDTQDVRWSKDAYNKFWETLKKLVLDFEFMRCVNTGFCALWYSPFILDSSTDQTHILWEMAKRNAEAQGNNTHPRETSATELELKNLPPLSSTTTASKKRKADLDPPDAPLEFKASSSRYKYVYSLRYASFSTNFPDTILFRREIYVVERTQPLTLSSFHPHLLTQTKCTWDY